MNTVREASIVVALLATVAALVIIVIVSGVDSVAATGLRDLAIALGGALAGVTVAKP